MQAPSRQRRCIITSFPPAVNSLEGEGSVLGDGKAISDQDVSHLSTKHDVHRLSYGNRDHHAGD